MPGPRAVRALRLGAVAAALRAPAGTLGSMVSCSADGSEDCRTTKCCTTPGFQCYEKNEWWASCMDACDPGEVDPYDGLTWSCSILSATDTPPPTPTMAPGSWVHGTWTTGYWDCCKPSCSWPGKGSVNQSTLSCSASTGAVLSDANVASVCDGGDAATCASNLPFQVSENLSMGFAAAAVGGVSGLNGDANCGQCFELVFTSQQHSDGTYPWGGAHPDLVGKRHVVQVTNIGYDVSGVHSFDLMIPGAGQGIFDNGCSRQFSGYSSGDFDCDNNYGGCSERSGCERLPPELRAGCYWRYDWYRWLASSGQTNNPWVSFRRVRCPQQLTAITDSVPLDDDSYPSHTMPTPPPTPAPPCEDDDAQMIAQATGAGYTISGCAGVQSFCDHPGVSSTVQTTCPATCGLCCSDDDAQIIALATGAGYTISGCAGVQSFCDHPAFGSTVQTTCPATCGLCTVGDRRLADGNGPNDDKLDWIEELTVPQADELDRIELVAPPTPALAAEVRQKTQEFSNSDTSLLYP